ncbi:hypothetical protein PhCBS80983_g06087 [Powellomyces hirtus]|uniref:Flavin reductase like domain-containing protein n=1 Tax=Powellomyces hirtus TaxID=109895 RepID=A0A507DRC5_9FUNG|nr:hypothetical protein PhCBS80983_g06087 [Powellomyces hirtus]
MSPPPSLFPPSHTPVFLLTTRLTPPKACPSAPPPYTPIPLQQSLKHTAAGQILTHAHSASILNDHILTLTLSKFNYTAQLVARHTRAFVLHLLEADHQAHLVPLFGTKTSRDVDKFANIACTLSPAFQYPLVSGAVAWCECKVEHIVDVEGERMVVIARVINRGGGGGHPLTMEIVKKGVSKGEWHALEDSYVRHKERDQRLAETSAATDAAAAAAVGVAPPKIAASRITYTSNAGTQAGDLLESLKAKI